MLRHIICLLISLSFLISGSAFSQQSTTAPTSDTISIEELIKKAMLRRSEYIQAFKDLSAEEAQKIEEYDYKGVKRRREIVSDLIIYQSPLDNSSRFEYRNVRLVDGKAVAGRDQRAEQLFARLAKSKSIKKELERLNRESSRYDLDTKVSGYTLNQGLPLDERFSRSFRFTDAGVEKIDGHEVIVIQYQQVSQNPELIIKLSSLPKKLQGAESLYRGRLWLDRETLRLRREVQEWTINHPSLQSPLTFMKFEFKYANSRFEILTPTQITISTFDRGRDKADGSAELLLGGKTTFEYGVFSRFEVTPDFQSNQ
jgi:hypothetical protein